MREWVPRPRVLLFCEPKRHRPDIFEYGERNIRAAPAVFAVVTEVKNQREWLYPTNPELHKFLYKAASLRNATDNSGIIPVFISPFRRNQAYQLARTLGFWAVRSEHQWVLDRRPLKKDGFYEVRDELGYADLRLGDELTIRFKRAMTESLARNARQVAERWSVTAALCEGLFDAARKLRAADEIGSIAGQARALVEDAAGPLPPSFEPITTRSSRKDA
ncbi:MAG: hypothetical protein GEU79_07175 [Acidimicrobiia bacterium]|nr:hypothetical protein [Acidimicrobiia bacterium]